MDDIDGGSPVSGTVDVVPPQSPPPQAKQRLEGILQRQGGLVTLRQAEALGLSRNFVQHRVTTKRWYRVLPGVFATFPGELTSRQLEVAALLWAQNGLRDRAAMLTGASALRAYGCRYAEDRRVHLLVSTARAEPRSPAVVLTRTRQLPRSGEAFGLPVAPPARAAIDAVTLLPTLRDQRALLCEVAQRRLATAAELITALGTRAGGTLHLARRALADVAANCWSAPECELRDLVATSLVLPEPLFNVRLSDIGGPAHMIADAAWPEARLVVEIDSIDFHADRDSAEATARRRNALIAAGWLVIDVTPGRLRREPRDVLAHIERAYCTRVSRP